MLTDTTVAGSVRPERQPVAGVAGGSLAGTTLEFCNHFLYGPVAAPVFPKLCLRRRTDKRQLLVAFGARPGGDAALRDCE